MRARLSAAVDLANPRITAADAERQRRTAAAILERLDHQPGVILADEVGMGKTFVALAVAYSVLEAYDFHTQIVVMVPNSVRHKWPREWSVFREKCLPESSPVRGARETVNDAVSFLKKLDDPDESRDHVLFATHNALTGQLQDPFVKLAILSRVLRRGSLEKQRAAFPRFARRILRDKRFDDPTLVDLLLSKSPIHWRPLWERHRSEPLDDDPVPHNVVEVMSEIRFDDLAAALESLPLRESAGIDGRLKGVRRAISRTMHGVWASFLAQIDFELPLLVLDEAHHLKNPDTQLARILTEGKDEEGNPVKGALAGVFRRMLFLSATPFQLGHHELIEILHRFHGTRWTESAERTEYAARVEELDRRLARAQITGLALDQAWSRIRPEDLTGAPHDWWQVTERAELPDRLQRAAEAIDRARGAIRSTEEALRPWVIRHTRPDRARRRRSLPGRSILDEVDEHRSGLRVAGDAVFPFLLAARAQAIVADEVRREGRRGQALFALGLASSFEAYRETRKRKLEELRDDQNGDVEDLSTPELDWYLKHIDRALPEDDRDRWGVHPKVEATVRRAIELWDRGEKTVVFCFYRATGRALRRHVSRALERRLLERGAERLGLSGSNPTRIREELRRISENRFDRDAPLRRAIEELTRATLLDAGVPTAWLESDPSARREGLLDLVVRFLRTPSFLVRYFDLRDVESLPEALRASYDSHRFGEQTLADQVHRLGRFLVDRTAEERDELLDALASVQTGNIEERPVDDDEEGDLGSLLPNVRLVNGKTRDATRRTLMLAFNTPFFPEILVASAVMAEGVDLHLACRHVIHHDLDWNPSVLEQRTGRLDRIGGKSEVVGRPIHVYEPFVEATQDEKLYRVVKDRERWFNVVMGEGLPVDEAATDKLGGRAELPLGVGSELSMNLALLPPGVSGGKS